MSLLEEAYEPCKMIDIKRVSDGAGGFETTYVDGVEFNAAIRRDSSTLGKIAEKQGVTDLYTITTKKSIVLRHPDILKRLSDGKIFKVTANGDDNRTPASASLNMRQVSAEEWSVN